MSCKKNKCKFCLYHNLDYKQSVIEKQKFLVELYKPITKNIKDLVVMKDNEHYRHKVTASFSNRNKQVVAGVYQEDTHQLIFNNGCYLQHSLANNIIDTIVHLANKFKIDAYNERTGYGTLRHAQIRISHLNNDVLLTLVIGVKEFKSSKNFAKAIIDKHPEIKSVVLNFNNRQTSVVLSSNDKVIIGSGKIMDSILDTKFLIGSNTFYQINPIQTEKLYQSIVDLANISKNDIVIDTYCGIGTISLILSKYAKQVIGVELNKESIVNAKKNASINKISNAVFINDDATKYINNYKGKIDVLIMDPTRAGATKVFMDAILRLKPKKIVYVSCDPNTQYRDIKQIKSMYNIESIQGFDMFPFVKHTESIALLKLNNYKK